MSKRRHSSVSAGDTFDGKCHWGLKVANLNDALKHKPPKVTPEDSRAKIYRDQKRIIRLTLTYARLCGQQFSV
jgi:hypothetical protein